MTAYKQPEMVEFMAKNPDAKIAVDQLARQAVFATGADHAHLTN